MSVALDLLTIEEYARLPDNGTLTELIRGRIVEVSRPTPRHGQICSKVAHIFGDSVAKSNVGRTVTNDCGIIIERDPDTLRGVDVAYYSYKNFPKGPLPSGYLDVAPEIGFEVKSEHDRWREINAKVGDMLRAGVLRVCVLDPDEEAISVYSADAPTEKLGPDDYLEFPDLVPGFRAQVRRFFA